MNTMQRSISPGEAKGPPPVDDGDGDGDGDDDSSSASSMDLDSFFLAGRSPQFLRDAVSDYMTNSAATNDELLREGLDQAEANNTDEARDDEDAVDDEALDDETLNAHFNRLQGAFTDLKPLAKTNPRTKDKTLYKREQRFKRLDKKVVKLTGKKKRKINITAPAHEPNDNHQEHTEKKRKIDDATIPSNESNNQHAMELTVGGATEVKAKRTKAALASSRSSYDKCIDSCLSDPSGRFDMLFNADQMKWVTKASKTGPYYKYKDGKRTFAQADRTLWHLSDSGQLRQQIPPDLYYSSAEMVYRELENDHRTHDSNFTPLTTKKHFHKACLRKFVKIDVEPFWQANGSKEKWIRKKQAARTQNSLPSSDLPLQLIGNPHNYTHGPAPPRNHDHQQSPGPPLYPPAPHPYGHEYMRGPAPYNGPAPFPPHPNAVLSPAGGNSISGISGNNNVQNIYYNSPAPKEG